MEKDGINFEIVLDRIIEVTERNLKMQSEFLQAVFEFKVRFDSVDRDNKEMELDIKTIVNNSFDIVHKMQMSPNEKIVSLVEQLKDNLNQFNSMNINIDACKGNIKGCEDHRLEVKDIQKDLKKIADSYSFIKKILGGIAILAIGFQIIFGMYQATKNDDLVKKIKIELKQKVKFRP